MQTVGSQLREVRESLGIQLEQAANVTRIGKNYLTAIEGDMFDKLPSSAYVKGFLRVYAGFLGLPGDDVVARYESQTAQNSMQAPDIPDAGRRSKNKTAFPRPLLLLTPILILITIAAVIHFITDGEEQRPKVSPPAGLRQSAAAPVYPVHSTAVGTGATAAALTGTREMELVRQVPLPPQTGIILKMRVNQDCWLNITIDDSMSQQYDLKAGDLIEWKGERVFALDLGNAGGVEAELNGRPLAPFGGLGMTAHVVLKGEGA